MQVNVITKEEFQQWAEAFAAQLTALIQGSDITPANHKTYNTDEAAAYLKVCKKTLQNYRDDGLITFSQIGRKITYAQSDLDSFLQAYKKQLFNKKVKTL